MVSPAAASPYEALLGVSHVKGKDDKEVAVSSFATKHLLLYFSAHWCPPCRGFTPKLADFYTKFAKTNDFEIVFVSSDQSKDDFTKYHAEQPWLALPYAERDQKAKLSSKFKVNGIPSLVVLSPDGKLITSDGRSMVMSDTECKDFPWKPKSLEEMLTDTVFVNGKGEKSNMADLKDKVVAFYFSAHWCGPCRGFTPELIKIYQKLKDAGKEFEIVFVSSDRDQTAFDEYFETMPWLALPFANRTLKNHLSKHFSVGGIPSLAIIDTDRSVITADGRGAVMADKEGEQFPWHPKALNDLSAGPGDLENNPSLIVFCDNIADQPNIRGVMESIAEEHWSAQKGKGEDPKFAFFTAFEENNLSKQMRKLTNLTSTGLHVLMVDCPGGGRYYKSDDNLCDKDALLEFMKTYKTKKNWELGEGGN